MAGFIKFSGAHCLLKLLVICGKLTTLYQKKKKKTFQGRSQKTSLPNSLPDKMHMRILGIHQSNAVIGNIFKSNQWGGPVIWHKLSLYLPCHLESCLSYFQSSFLGSRWEIAQSLSPCHVHRRPR